MNIEKREMLLDMSQKTDIQAFVFERKAIIRTRISKTGARKTTHLQYDDLVLLHQKLTKIISIIDGRNLRDSMTEKEQKKEKFGLEYNCAICGTYKRETPKTENKTEKNR